MTEKLKIGITGGVGSGKSLAASYFEELGYPVIYADKVAKQLYTSNKLLLSKLVKEFGKSIIDEHGNLSRENARKIIFSSKKNIKRVNSVVHPFVFRQMDKIYSKLKSRIVFFEAAIMFESGSYKRMNYVLLIFTNKELRIKRLVKRDNLSRADILKIMKMQLPETEKLKRADFVIKNNSTPAALKRKITAFSKILEEL
ncbi:MAG: dephospho-CoA kinase [Chlorobi bacterium OLB5]|nr:MAG: dephospho-CoA kinase [Chlorobi bacterium OLB5]